MGHIRRKPRAPFPYVLQADQGLPADEQPRFIIEPPSQRRWAELMDDAPGTSSMLVECAVRFVVRLENHPDAEAFGAADTPARRAFVDDVLGVDVTRELGNAVANTLLTETDRKN